MRAHVVTLFPELFGSFLRGGILGKAIGRGLAEVHFTNPRDFAVGRHRSVDDAPYGGGSGMVMRVEPVVDALESLDRYGGAHKVLLTPQGVPFRQAEAARLASLPSIALVCGRYEGFDERIRGFVDQELSLGDFVLMGGEVAAMTVLEATIRLLPGVLGNSASTVDESHGVAGALEHPQYTRPPEFRGVSVPDVLLSGHHAVVERWRRAQALARTRERRPDLFSELELSDDDRAMLEELDS